MAETKDKGPKKEKGTKSKEKKIKKAFTVPHIDPEEIVLKGLLGKGCFGKVYVGECRSIEVAVKVPKKQNLSKRNLRNFIKEVEIMSKIYHPNVCLFMGACTSPGNIRIVSEKLEIDLESKVHNLAEEIPLTQRMQWAKEACQGMAWLHGSDPPIIHRDLKPANMLLDEHSKIKVCDFGLSHFMEEGLYDKEPKGTPLYMAPEVMRKEEITEKVDVYSIGIIMWELLTREDPFADHEDYQTFVNAVCKERERPILPAWTPKRLHALITSCWEEDPNKRPSMAEIITLLDSCMDEIVALEHAQKIDAAVDDANGRIFWKKKFPLKTSVPWTEFAHEFYSHVKLPLPRDPFNTVLASNATVAELQKVGINQLKQYAKLGSAQAQNAAAEIKRRELGNFTASYKTFGDADCDAMTDDVRTMYCLKAVLADNDEEIVTLEEFGKLLGWLGPFEVPASPEDGFLDRLVDLLNQPYFHGAIQTSHTEKLLRVQPAGTFLVRFSNSQKNCYCISKVSAQGANKVIKHIVIPYQVGKGYQLDKEWYGSLPELISMNEGKYTLATPCPGSKYSWMFESDIAEVGGYGVSNEI